MTTKTKSKIATITIVSATLLLTMVLQPVFADHPLYNGHKHFWGNTDICYILSEFDNMKVDGSFNQSTKVDAETDVAKNDWNSQSSPFSFNIKSSCSHQVGASGLGSGFVGLTTISYDVFGFVWDVDFDYDTSDRTWDSGTTCSTNNPANIRYVGTHELGHWLVFNHAFTGGASHTVMWNAYDCNGRTVQSADASELDDVY